MFMRFKKVNLLFGILLTLFIILFIIALIIYRIKSNDETDKWASYKEYIILDQPSNVNKNYYLPKIIWSYWHDENIPQFVNNVLKQRAAVLSGWDIKVLNSNTIHNHFDEFPPNYANMIQSHKSDWLRLALLKKYGGCWLDATILINSLSSFDAMYTKSVEQHSEFTGFYTPKSIMGGDPTTFIESWFIMAPLGSRIIKEWYGEFNTACIMGFTEYRIKLMKEHTFSKDIYKTHDPDVYLTVYAALQKTIHKNLHKQVNMVLFNSFDAMYKLHIDCWSPWNDDYDSKCIVKKLQNSKEYVKKIPYFKFTKAQYSLMSTIDVNGYFD